jgi:hypothetical protein
MLPTRADHARAGVDKSLIFLRLANALRLVVQG